MDKLTGNSPVSDWLIDLGWTEQRQAAFNRLGLDGTVPARVVAEYKGMYRVFAEGGELLAEVSGRMRHEATGRAAYPAVGDWAAEQRLDGDRRGIIHAVLPRSSKFSRKMAGQVPDEQIVAANVDTVWLVCALNRDYNMRRLERYLVLAWESGASPVIVLTKADLSDRVSEQVLEAESIAPGVPVIVTSVVTGDGLDALRAQAVRGRTFALLGSSGAGKSSLVNALLGEDVQAVQGVRAGDDRGRHTTTHRELFRMPDGGILIDTPGMRELQLWHADTGIEETFADVEAWMRRCRFSDCRHSGEPGCAVEAALAGGELDPGRYASYLKLQRELDYLARKENSGQRQHDKAFGKKIAKFQKELYRGRNRK